MLARVNPASKREEEIIFYCQLSQLDHMPLSFPHLSKKHYTTKKNDKWWGQAKQATEGVGETFLNKLKLPILYSINSSTIFSTLGLHFLSFLKQVNYERDGEIIGWVFN